MKITLITAAFFALSSLTFGQNQSMTIAHSGITPNDVLTVFAGDSIDFIFGSGTTHPMTEGWGSGESSTPVPFVTQTVSSTISSVTFALDAVGTYYFHCGSNPSNEAVWGKIIVLEAGTAETTELNKSNTFSIYPNPVNNILNIKEIEGESSVFDIDGKVVLIITEASTDVSHLDAGIYFIEVNGVRTKFIKN